MDEIDRRAAASGRGPVSLVVPPESERRSRSPAARSRSQEPDGEQPPSGVSRRRARRQRWNDRGPPPLPPPAQGPNQNSLNQDRASSERGRSASPRGNAAASGGQPRGRSTAAGSDRGRQAAQTPVRTVSAEGDRSAAGGDRGGPRRRQNKGAGKGKGKGKKKGGRR